MYDLLKFSCANCSLVYKTTTGVQSHKNALVRKSHYHNLSVVESFILEARGDQITVADITKMNAMLSTIDRVSPHLFLLL